MATTDFLTGLPSRRSFIIRLEDELARLNRAIEQPIALLMLDLDHFKNVNDSYGHATGDSMLKHFANLVANELRRIDMAGRLGGEEFGIVLPGADVAAAKAFAERLCERIGNSPLLLNGSRIPFTVSIGVTHLRISDTDPDVALARADKFLYRAKERGRNRVEVDDELASA
jgi:diguanylate cyclase (GGDEF)-like protein